jgi:hypothetical protein
MYIFFQYKKRHKPEHVISQLNVFASDMHSEIII